MSGLGITLHFTCKSQENREPTSGPKEPLTPAPATSLLAYILARPSASGNCACLGNFRRVKAELVSVAYRCVSEEVAVRLQYAFTYLGRHYRHYTLIS